MNQLIGYLSEGEQLKGSLTIPKQLGGSTLGSKTITANGVYDATDDGLDGYDVVTANVPNTYAAGDEGKVVDNGALVSQTTATYTVNNTYDTTKIKSVTVNVGGGSPTLETITKTYTPSTSQQTDTITAGVGYDGITEVDVTVNAMPTGTEGTPTATKGAVSNHSVSVTPSVTNAAGYIAGGTKTGTAVTVNASELVSGTKSITANGTGIDVTNYEDVDVAVPNSYTAADEGKVVNNGALVAQTAHADVTPTTSDQTIDTTLNNSLKVKGDADLVAGNIKKDVELFGVTGTYEGGGGNLGGLANMVDETSVDISYAFMLSAMKNGNTKGGTITWANAFPNTETLMLSTGLTQLNGIILAQTDRGFGSTQNNNQTNEFVIIFCRHYTDGVPANYSIQAINMNHSLAQSNSHEWGTAYNSAPENGTLRLSGGDIYFTGRYNANNAYQIVRAGEPYEWLAW